MGLLFLFFGKTISSAIVWQMFQNTWRHKIIIKLLSMGHQLKTRWSWSWWDWCDTLMKKNKECSRMLSFGTYNWEKVRYKSFLTDFIRIPTNCSNWLIGCLKYRWRTQPRKNLTEFFFLIIFNIKPSTNDKISLQNYS